jgi:hypothetical protein
MACGRSTCRAGSAITAEKIGTVIGIIGAMSTAVRKWLKTSGLKLQRGHTSLSISW